MNARMFPTLSLLAWGALAATIVGCSHGLSKKDCEQADYYELGLEDGRDGKGAERLQSYRDACAKEGVAVRDDRYTYGRQVGLAEYCDEGRAKKDAQKGNRDNVCLREKVPPYQTAYQRALDDRRAEIAKELEKVSEERKKLQSQQDQIQGEMNEIDAQKTVVQ